MSDEHTNGFDERDDEISAEELLECLRSTTLVMILGTIQFLEERRIPVDDWIVDLSTIFARGWDLNEDWSPEELLQAVLFNLAALGGETIQAQYGDDDASAVVERFPDKERVAELGLDETNGDIILNLVRPIAAACGMNWSWRRDGDRIIVELSRSKVTT